MPLSLAEYQIDPVHGFVAPDEPPTALPPGFAAWDRLAADLPALIRSQRLGAVLAGLPVLDPAALPDAPARERALLILSVLANAHVHGHVHAHVHAHVHGGPAPAARLPAGVAVPLWALSQAMDRVAIVTHASMVLNNWRRIDPLLPLSADNAALNVIFLGGVDEEWFFLATLGVELAGAPALGELAGLGDRVRAGDDAGLAAALGRIGAAVAAMRAALARMGDWCEPRAFYTRIRPFLAGWPGAGLVYEGVSDTPVPLLGGSAAQSTLIQALDAGLGVRHARPGPGDFLAEMRRYMPAPHRAFLDALEAGPDLAAHVAASGHDALRGTYGACLTALGDLRRDHMAMAARYIIAQAPREGAGAAIGTGGTEFVPFLRATREATLALRPDRAHP